MATAKKTRKKKWASPLAQKQHSSARQALIRQAAKREHEEQIRSLEIIRTADHKLVRSEFNRRINMVQGLQPRLSAVMKSWGIDVPVKLTPSRRVGGWTDFKSINVEYSEKLVFNGDEHNLISIENLQQLVVETRALFYHELGHILFTIPVNELCVLAYRSGFDFDSADIPVYVSIYDKETYKQECQKALDKTGTQHFHSVEMGSDSSVGAVTYMVFVNRAFRNAWNALEDQRMEMALVNESPHLASYLTILVARNILSRLDARKVYGDIFDTRKKQEVEQLSWMLIAGRHYLPQEVRDLSESTWNSSFRATEIATSDRVLEIVSNYQSASSAKAMIEAINDYLQLTKPLSDEALAGVDSHKYSSSVDSSDERFDNIEKRLSETTSERPKADPSKKKENSEHQTNGEQNSSGDKSNSSDENKNGFGSNTSDNALKDAIEKSLNDHFSNIADSQELKDDIRAVNEAYSNDTSGLAYGNVGAGTAGLNPYEEQAKSIVAQISDSFRSATADTAPTWVSGQRRGVLEPIRYRTRQMGDLEFFKDFRGEGDREVSVEVSLFIDISGSMWDFTDQLAAAAWAVKAACDAIDVRCDVTMFDHNAYKLWSADEVASPEIPILESQGGTDPTYAFQTVLGSPREVKNHVIIVLTDGVWESDKSFARSNNSSNDLSLLLRFDSNFSKPISSVELATKYGFQEAQYIGDLLAIPQALESLLLNAV